MKRLFQLRMNLKAINGFSSYTQVNVEQWDFAQSRCNARAEFLFCKD